MILRMAWRNVWRHPRRSGLTIAAISATATLLIFSITLQLGAYDVMIDSTLRQFTGYLQVQRQGYLDRPGLRLDIPGAAALARRIEERTGTTVAMRGQAFALASSGSRSHGVMVVGVEPSREPRVSNLPETIRHGRYLAATNAYESVLGEALARRLKVEVGDELTLLGSGREGSMAAAVVRVVGLFESGARKLDQNLVEIPLPVFQSVFNLPDAAHSLVVSAGNARQAALLADRVRLLLPPASGLVALQWGQLLPGLKQLIEADKTEGWIIYGALVLVVTLSITNTFLMAVLERTREFGILLALGMRPSRIAFLVMLESLLLVLLGLGLGLVLGGGLTAYFHFQGFTYPGLAELGTEINIPTTIYPQISFAAFFLGPGGILLFTLLAAGYPAWRVRRLQPVEAIRTPA